MFAVIKANGKQYRVAAADEITIDRLDAEVGSVFTFPVLMLGGATIAIGAPHVDGATVTGEVVEQTRGDKVIAFKKRRRQNSRRKRGHRQDYTRVRITEILTDGKQPSKEAKGTASRAAKPKVENKAAEA